MKRLRSAGRIVARAGAAFFDHEPFQHAAALSYYTLLSMAPLMLIVTGLAGFLLGQEDVQRQLVEEVRGLIGDEGAEVLATVMANVDRPERGVLSMVVGGVLIIVGATTVFAQLQTSLNFVWNVRAAPANALVGFLRARLISFGVVLGLGFMLLVSLVLSAVLTALWDRVDAYLPGAPTLWSLLNNGFTLAIVTLLIAALFKFVPDAYIEWRDTWLGALCTALLLAAGKGVIGLYLGQASVGSAYGAAGSTLVLMAWVYYASLILLFGAELTHAIAQHRGAPVRPSRYARPVTPAQAIVREHGQPDG